MTTPAASSPEWLAAWLRIPFYDQTCNEHDKLTTLYCARCMGQPFCERCWALHDQCHDHVLQVCKSSRRTAIDVERIMRLYDISNIQKYIINGKNIVYLNPKWDSNGDSRLSSKCKICARRLKDTSPYSFCSIECKSQSVEPQMQLEMKNDVKSMRERSRKGIPRRAPLK